MLIRSVHTGDAAALWRVLKPMIREGETCALPSDMSEAEAIAYWTNPAWSVFVAEAEGCLLGSYYLRPNQLGGGAHIANCGYVTAAEARGRSVARAMCVHSMDMARRAGYHAMQFNIVLSTNAPAVHLWRDLGFETIGRIPSAFLHPRFGYIEALIMYRAL